MKFRFIGLQFAIFFKREISRPDIFVYPLTKKLSSIFDNPPIILPFLQDAPKEIPTVQMDSKNGEYKCNIGRVRIDFYYNPKKVCKDFSEIEKEVKKILNSFINIVNKEAKDNLFKVGYVVRYFIEDTNAIRTLQEKYIKKEFNDLQRIALRFDRGKEFVDLKVNDITKLETVNEDLLGNPKKGYVLERDINNISSPKKLEEKKLKEFIRECSKRYRSSSIEKEI